MEAVLRREPEDRPVVQSRHASCVIVGEENRITQYKLMHSNDNHSPVMLFIPSHRGMMRETYHDHRGFSPTRLT